MGASSVITWVVVTWIRARADSESEGLFSDAKGLLPQAGQGHLLMN